MALRRDERETPRGALRRWRAGAWPPTEGALPVLLVPGFLGDVDVFAGLEAALSASAPLLSWDLRGLTGPAAGSLAGEPPTIEDHAADALALLDAADLPRVAVVGWSAGAVIAAELARQAPARVAAVVAIAGVFGGPIERLVRRLSAPAGELAALALGLGAEAARGRAVPAWLASTLRQPWAGEALHLGGLLGEHIDPRPAQELLARSLGGDLQAQIAAWRALAAYLQRHPRPRLAAPSLFFAGSRDPFAGPAVARAAAASCATARLELVRGGGHLLPLEQSELLGLQIGAFLAEAASKAS